MSEIAKSDLFEAAFIGARSTQNEYWITDLECSEYHNSPNSKIRTEIPIAVLGGFTIAGKLVTEEVVRSTGLVEYKTEPGEIESKAGTHIDKALKEVDSYTGGYSKEFWQQTLTSAGVNCIYEAESTDDTKLVAGVMTFYKPIEDKFRSIFTYDKKFDDAQNRVRRKAYELEIGDTMPSSNPIHAISRIEAPESKILIARAAASCCIRACGCAGLDMPAARRADPNRLRN